VLGTATMAMITNGRKRPINTTVIQNRANASHK
jgi:hypothetical protein